MGPTEHLKELSSCKLSEITHLVHWPELGPNNFIYLARLFIDGAFIFGSFTVILFPFVSIF